MLQVNAIHFRYDDAPEPVLRDVCFDAGRGERVALIGDNGRGKTTLLRILLGELVPTSGAVVAPRHDFKLGYLPQDIVFSPNDTPWSACEAAAGDIGATAAELRALEQRMSRAAGDELTHLTERYGELQQRFASLDGYTLDTRIGRALHRVDLPEAMWRRPCRLLSGGEKTRTALARLLLTRCPMLLLDEPTNHLDLDGVLWLEDWLRRCGLTVLFVSHDRVFIDNVADKVVSLEHDGCHTQRGGYSDYRANREHEAAHQMAQWEERSKKIRQLHAAAQKRRQWAGKFKKQNGAEGAGHVYESIVNPAKTMMQQAKHIEERMKMLQTRYPVEKPWIEKQHAIHFQLAEPPGGVIFACRDISLRFGEQTVFDNLNLHLFKGESVHLTGPNGAGKTSLLRLWMGELTPNSGEVARGGRLKVGLFDQEHSFLPRDQQALQWLLSRNGDETFVRTVMGCLGLEQDKALRRIGAMSVGERAKTALASLLVDSSNVLLLDEPTNHLDLRAREQLESALQSFPGTIVFVSHDRWFIKRLATRTLELSGSR